MRQSLVADRAPSMQASSVRWVNWGNGSDILGQPFDVTKIPLSKLHQMRRDPIIAFGGMFIRMPLMRAPWYIQCKDAQAAAFLDGALREIWPRLVGAYCNSLDFGYAGIVKRFERRIPDWTYWVGEEEKKAWDSERVEALVWKSPVTLPPDDVEPHWNSKGEFDGIDIRPQEVQTRDFSMLGRGRRKDKADIPLDWSLWATNDKDSVFGSVWGYPRIAHAYRYWWSYWYRWGLLDRGFERHADPAVQVYYPNVDGEVDENGNARDYRSLALMLGENIRAGSTIALPGDMIEGMDGQQGTKRKWEISYLSDNGATSFSAFQESFAYLDVAKLRAMMLPEQAFMEGRGGTSSRNVAEQLGDVFLESQATLMAELDDMVNRYLIPQLLEANFGDRRISAKKVTAGFAAQDVDLARQIVALVGQSNPNDLQVDMRELLDQMGIPLLTPVEVRKKEEKIAEEQQAMQPAPQAPSNGWAGVNQWGFYQQAREQIHLADEPPIPALEDRETRDVVKQIEEAWREILREAYGSFADHLEAMPEDAVMASDDDDDPDFVGLGFSLRDLFKGWWANLTKAERRDSIQDKLTATMVSIADRAAEREAATHGLDVNWSQKMPEVSKYLRNRAADMVANIDDTTRAELKRFVTRELGQSKSPAEIGKSLRDHFSQFPEWRARRIARTEAQNAYNFAALNTYAQAGVELVMARDAARPERSDAHCIERDGNIYSIEDAFKETLDEHPNGTLHWAPVRSQLPVGLSIEQQGEVVVDGQVVAAEFERGTMTVRLAQDISDEDAFRFLDAVANELRTDPDLRPLTLAEYRVKPKTDRRGLPKYTQHLKAAILAKAPGPGRAKGRFPVAGEVVATFPEHEMHIPLSDFSMDAVRAYVEDPKRRALLAHEDNFLGAWQDGDQLILDVVHVSDTRRLATMLGGWDGKLAVVDTDRS